MWLATRAALPGAVAQLHTNYHIPISNTATGLMLMEAVAQRSPGRARLHESASLQLQR